MEIIGVEGRASGAGAGEGDSSTFSLLSSGLGRLVVEFADEDPWGCWDWDASGSFSGIKVRLTMNLFGFALIASSSWKKRKIS